MSSIFMISRLHPTARGNCQADISCPKSLHIYNHLMEMSNWETWLRIIPYLVEAAAAGSLVSWAPRSACCLGLPAS